MHRKIIGIFVCILLISTVLPITVIANGSKSETLNDVPPCSIWFVRGIFKYLDEDKEYIYLKATFSKLIGIQPGIVWYRLINCPIKVSKPFKGIFTNDFSVVILGICNAWDFVDT